VYLTAPSIAPRAAEAPLELPMKPNGFSMHMRGGVSSRQRAKETPSPEGLRLIAPLFAVERASARAGDTAEERFARRERESVPSSKSFETGSTTSAPSFRSAWPSSTSRSSSSPLGSCRRDLTPTLLHARSR
jgi:hypothetical protein